MHTAKDGRGLFMQSNGLPMVFHLPPGSTKKKLAPIIKQHGGEITSRSLNNVIRLADEKLWTSRILLSSSDCYWPTYIMDCVKQDTLLDMEPYRCSKGKRLMRNISIEDGAESSANEYDFAFGDDMALTRSTRSRKGRMHYTKAEDMNILKYLMEKGEYRRTKGLAVWNTMEKLQITPHSAQSMMARFLKVIVEQLDDYNIPDNWKSCLSGDIARYARTTKATSAKGGEEKRAFEKEAMDAWTKRVTIDRFSPQPSTSRACQPRSEPPVEDTQISGDSVVEAENEETNDSFDQQLFQMAHADKQEVTDDRTDVTVSAGDPVVSAHEPSRSAAEPRVNGSGTEHSSVKRRRGERKESECEEREEEEALPLLSTPEQRLCRMVQQRLKKPRRSPRKSSQKAAAPPADSRDVVEEEEPQGRKTPDRCQIPTRSLSTEHTPPSTGSTLLCPVTPPICTNAVLSASPSSEIGASPSTSKEKEKYGKHTEKKTKRMTALGVIRALSEEFDLTLREAKALFWRNSGHVDATRYWIMTGRTLQGHYYWKPEDDQVLLTCEPDHPLWQRLEDMYGLLPVQHRIQWLHAHQ